MDFNKENVIKEIKKAKSLAFENCVVSEIPIRYLNGVLNAIELMEERNEDPFEVIRCIGYENRCNCKRCKERSLYESFGSDKLSQEEIDFWNEAHTSSNNTEEERRWIALESFF